MNSVTIEQFDVMVTLQVHVLVRVGAIVGVQVSTTALCVHCQPSHVHCQPNQV